MKDKIEEKKRDFEATYEHEMAKRDFLVARKADNLRDRFGMSTILARLVDVGMIALGAWVAVSFGGLSITGGVALLGAAFLVISGLFGFIKNVPSVDDLKNDIRRDRRQDGDDA